MSYLFYFLIVTVIFIGLLVFLRKLTWDTIHQNLLDLVDDLGGKVTRRGYASRPIYQGTYKNEQVMINFSRGKSKKGSINYIDVTLGHKAGKTLTISSKIWLASMGEHNPSDYVSFPLKDNENYVLRPASDNQVRELAGNEEFIDILEKLSPFAYMFISQNGILYEIPSQNIIEDTRHPLLKEKIQLLYNLSRVIQA